MKFLQIIFNFVFIFIIFLFSGCYQIGDREKIFVDSVIWKDGDTLSYRNINDNHFNNLRLMSIDAPEYHDQYHNFQTTDKSGKYIEYFFAVKSFKIAKNFSKGNCQYILKYNVDKYKRIIGEYFVDDMRYEEYILSHGLAIIAYSDHQDKKLIDSEDYAIKNNLGFWSYIKSGTIPIDAPIEFVKESLTLDTKSKRLSHVFNKLSKEKKYAILNNALM